MTRGQEMRCRRANATLRLQAKVSIQRVQRAHKTLDVLARAGVHNVKIESADRRPFEDRRDAVYDDEVNPVLRERAYNRQEISCRHSGRGSLRPN